MDKLSATCQRLLREARAKVLKDSQEAPKKTGEGTIDPEEPSELAAKSSLVSLRVGLGFELCACLHGIFLLFEDVCLSSLVGSRPCHLDVALEFRSNFVCSLFHVCCE